MTQSHRTTNISANSIDSTITRASYIAGKIAAILSDLSGINTEDISTTARFIELGFDSLFLTQANTRIKKEFKVQVTFRHLFEETPTIDTLSTYIDKNLPPEALQEALHALVPKLEPAADTTAFATVPEIATGVPAPTTANGAGADTTACSMTIAEASTVESVIRQQLSLMEKQVALLQEAGSTTVPPAALENVLPIGAAESPKPNSPAPIAVGKVNEYSTLIGKLPMSTDGNSRASASSAELSDLQQNSLRELISKYCQKTARSKASAEKWRPTLADNRVVGGFDSLWKEMTYLLVCERSDASRVWDIDGNEYVDITMCFGAALGGHSPEPIKQAIKKQLDRGYQVAIQNELAGEVAELVCELTGNERLTFAHSGCEAVAYAIRIARAATSRDKIVYFNGDIHGRSDSVLGRSLFRNGDVQTFPAAIGVPDDVAKNAVVLDYGTPEALQWIRANAHDLAAVLVEPVRTRNPDLQPIDFLQELRQICDEKGALLIFDEVVMGFRVHNGGAQAFFDIRADLVTYGKALGGGLPIGAVAGKRKYLDMIDGGTWNYGDESRPEVGMTVSGGTMIKHPLALAAAKEVLLELKNSGGKLQNDLSERTGAFASELNNYFTTKNIPIHLEQFSSYFLPRFIGDRRFEWLYTAYLRMHGVHIYHGYPCFMSFAHSNVDIDFLIDAFKSAGHDIQQSGFLDTEPKPVGPDSGMRRV